METADQPLDDDFDDDGDLPDVEDAVTEGVPSDTDALDVRIGSRRRRRCGRSPRPPASTS
jgi:hypothetical protein